MKRIAIKLRRISLLHFVLVTFRFHYGESRKPLIFMISGFSDVSMTHKTNIIYLWRHQDTSNDSRSRIILACGIKYKSSIYFLMKIPRNTNNDHHNPSNSNWNSNRTSHSRPPPWKRRKAREHVAASQRNRSAF